MSFKSANSSWDSSDSNVEIVNEDLSPTQNENESSLEIEETENVSETHEENETVEEQNDQENEANEEGGEEDANDETNLEENQDVATEDSVNSIFQNADNFAVQDLASNASQNNFTALLKNRVSMDIVDGLGRLVRNPSTSGSGGSSRMQAAGDTFNLNAHKLDLPKTTGSKRKLGSLPVETVSMPDPKRLKSFLKENVDKTALPAVDKRSGGGGGAGRSGGQSQSGKSGKAGQSGQSNRTSRTSTKQVVHVQKQVVVNTRTETKRTPSKSTDRANTKPSAPSAERPKKMPAKPKHSSELVNQKPRTRSAGRPKTTQATPKPKQSAVRKSRTRSAGRPKKTLTRTKPVKRARSKSSARSAGPPKKKTPAKSKPKN